jgi:hypothetical protein
MAAPEEKQQPRGQVEVADTIDGARCQDTTASGHVHLARQSGRHELVLPLLQSPYRLVLHLGVGGLRQHLSQTGPGRDRQSAPDAWRNNTNLQSDNLTDELRARGLATSNTALAVYDSALSAGGRIKRDKARFYTTARLAGARVQFNRTQGTPTSQGRMRSRPGSRCRRVAKTFDARSTAT